MVREIAVNIWCDMCMREEVETEGTTSRPITIGNAKPRTLDLCERHEKEILEPLLAVLNSLGVKVDSDEAPQASKRIRSTDKARLVPGPFHCKVPNCTNNMGRGYGSRGSMQSHVRNTHHITYTEYVVKYGEPVAGDTTDVEGALPLDMDVDGELPDQFKCGVGDCDKVYSPDKYSRPAQALGVHRFQAHGIRANKNNAA